MEKTRNFIMILKEGLLTMKIYLAGDPNGNKLSFFTENIKNRLLSYHYIVIKSKSLKEFYLRVKNENISS